jgi:hypothetical protein
VHPLGPSFLRIREEDVFTFEGTALRTLLPRPTAKEVGNSSSYGRDASPVSTTSKNPGLLISVGVTPALSCER